MSRSLPYESATSGDAALTEIQRILGKFGCESFGHMVDVERGMTIVQFKHRGRQISIEASWKGYAQAWFKTHPYSYRTKGSRADYDARALAIGRSAVCSILRDWIKGNVTAIECGILSAEAVFMPHMLLPTGERLIDRITGPNGILRLGSDT